MKRLNNYVDFKFSSKRQSLYLIEKGEIKLVIPCKNEKQAKFIEFYLSKLNVNEEVKKD